MLAQFGEAPQHVDEPDEQRIVLKTRFRDMLEKRDHPFPILRPRMNAEVEFLDRGAAVFRSRHDHH